jgi:hypothetical protein
MFHTNTILPVLDMLSVGLLDLNVQGSGKAEQTGVFLHVVF